MKIEIIKLNKALCKNLLLIAQILLIFMALVPPPALAARTATLSVDPPSGVMTYPTYTINIIITPVTDLWQIHFRLSYNDGVDFLEVPTGGVELGDLFAGQEPLLSTGDYYLSDTGLSYLEVLIEMPGNDTVSSSVSISLARITFRLLDNAMPGMTSWLKLEWADATFFTGVGETPYEYIDSDSGITLQSGTVELSYLVTTLTVDPATGTVEKPVTLSSTLKDGDGNPIAGESVDYYVDSQFVGSATTNDFGVSSVSYTPPDVGTFTITAEYVAPIVGKYAGSNGTATLTVNRRDTTLSLSVKSSIKVGETVDLIATLEKDATPMSGETIQFYVDSTPQGSATTNANGTASVQYTFSDVGTYEIKAEYAGTTRYAPSSDTTTRTVAMQTTSLELTVTPQITKVDQDVTLSVVLKDENCSRLPNQIIEYYVNTELVGSDTTDANGVSSITYTPIEASPPEGWEVEARYGGDPSYSSSVDTAILVVNKLATTLTLSVQPTTITIEDTIVMTATLKDENTQAISSSNIDYYIMPEDRWIKIDSEITGGDGVASLVYEPTTTGDLWVKANYTGSSRYLADDSNFVKVTVNKLATTLTLSFRTPVKVEQTVMMSATLKDGNQKAIPNVTIEYYILTGVLEPIGSAKTNQDGVASLPYTPTDVGNFTITAIFSESTKYFPSSDSQLLTVNPIATTLTLDVADTARVGDTVTLAATLKDENENPLRGLLIEYYIYSGEAWSNIGTAVTNSSGVATRDFTPSEAGSFLIRAEFGGDAKHAETTSQEATLTVNKVQTTLAISLSDTTTTLETSIVISATLEDEDAQPISRSGVSFEIFKDGTWTGIGSATTNLQGVASLNFQPTEAGTFKVRAVYTGDQKYAESTSEEVTLEVTGGPSPGPLIDLGFLLDEELTSLDLLFWGFIIVVILTIVFVIVWRKVKSATQTYTGAVQNPT